MRYFLGKSGQERPRWPRHSEKLANSFNDYYSPEAVPWTILSEVLP